MKICSSEKISTIPSYIKVLCYANNGSALAHLWFSASKGVKGKGLFVWPQIMRCSCVNYFYTLISFVKIVKTLMIPSEDLLIKMHEKGMFNRINFVSKEDTTRMALR